MSPAPTRWPRCSVGLALRAACAGRRCGAAGPCALWPAVGPGPRMPAAAAAGSGPRPTRSSARPISQSRLGTTSPAGVNAILRSSAWLPGVLAPEAADDVDGLLAA